MSNKIIFSFPENIALAKLISEKSNIEVGDFEMRSYPDDETYIRIISNVKDKMAILICSLDHPNPKILPLMFIAQTLKRLGARKICLVAPYLAYMRHDKEFKSGEAVTAFLFSQFVSSWIDHLITIDPHLHRIHALSDIYKIDSISTLHATQNIANWILKHVESPILIGPDEESKQWVSEIAAMAQTPYVVCQKVRLGDESVQLTLPPIQETEKTAVLVDDIISTGTSMLATIKALSSQGFKNPICIGVHALLSDTVHERLLQAGVKNILTSNTIPHPTNAIDISDLLAGSIAKI